MRYRKGLELKYFYSGPAPIGRVLNYIKRIKKHRYRSLYRGGVKRPRDYRKNLDQWTVFFMVGLRLVRKPVLSSKLSLHLTEKGEYFYRRLLPYGARFPEGTSDTTVADVRRRLERFDRTLYDELKDYFLRSPPVSRILTFFRDKRITRLERTTFYSKFGRKVGIKRAGFNRLPSSLQLLEFCGGLTRSKRQITLTEAVVDKAEVVRQVKEKLGGGIDSDDSLSSDFLGDVSVHAADPGVRKLVVRIVRRNKRAANKLKKLYNGRCQVCRMTFKTKHGENYAEIHHLKPIGEEGSDRPSNMVVVCPTCHRKFHYSEWKKFGRNSKGIPIRMAGAIQLIRFVPAHLKIFEGQ